MNGFEKLKEVLSKYHSNWRNPRLAPLKTSEPYDLDNDFDKFYPCATEPGCYMFFSKDWEISYIGKAVNLGRRIGSYLRQDRPSRKMLLLYEWKLQPRYIVAVSVKERFEAPSLEEYLIQRLDPPDNTQGRNWVE